MKYRLSDDTWNQKELDAIQGVIDSRMFSMGKKVKEFEEEFAKKFGAKYAIMSNSGSSANLLAIAALVYSKRLNIGDEVIVPAVSWSTTYYPLYQLGLKLIFVDINRETLNIDIEQLKQAISEKTKMIFAVNLLGNPNEFNEIINICDKKRIILVEDNCESMGAEYQGKKLGTIGLMGTFSTFYSHHLCTMEGGMTVTDDEELYHYMLAIRAHGWTRNLPDDSKIYKKNKNKFYESFNFIVPGFNLRPIEIEAAVGIEQLKKLDDIIRQRKENAKYFKSKLVDIQGIKTQKEIEESSWFGFAILLEDKWKSKRDIIVERLIEKGIEVRPIVAGNFTKNRVIEYMSYEIRGELINADYIHDSGFFIGNHSTNNFKEIDYFVESLSVILKETGE